jgi:hypothetical protein
MNKDDRKSFYRFANSATNLELEAKLIQLHNLILKLKESSTIAEANWMTKGNLFRTGCKKRYTCLNRLYALFFGV